MVQKQMDEATQMVQQSISRKIRLCETQWDYFCSNWRLVWDLSTLWLGNESARREIGVRPADLQRKRN